MSWLDDMEAADPAYPDPGADPWVSPAQIPDTSPAMPDTEVEQQIADEQIDQALARRDVADRSLTDAAAAMRQSRAELDPYEVHARLDDGHLTRPGR